MTLLGDEPEMAAGPLPKEEETQQSRVGKTILELFPKERGLPVDRTGPIEMMIDQ